MTTACATSWPRPTRSWETSEIENHARPSKIVEVCAEGLASALAAGEGGADRVELCENLAVGGVTPGPGAIAVACDRLAIPVHILVRPRGGGFVYSRPEVEAMRLDVLAAKKRGASGVVLGLLEPSGAIDRDRTARLAELARPMSATFHKAFDATPDPFAALDLLIGLGVDRVLTSGQAPSARLGVATLADLVRHASGRIAIQAGGRIGARDLPPLVASGVAEVHVGSSVAREGAVDTGLVRSFVDAARDAFAAPRPARSGPIYHLAPRADWDRAVAEAAPYRAGSLATEGFIHASEAHQVAGSASLFFRGRRDVVVLEIDPEKLRAPLVLEYAPDRDEWFPHLYGPLEREAVVAVTLLMPDTDGCFRWPPG